MAELFPEYLQNHNNDIKLLNVYYEVFCTEAQGTEGLLITAERRAQDLTRQATNIYPDAGVGSHASQAKEERPKDCTDAKWWYKKAKGRRNKLWTFCEIKNGRANAREGRGPSLNEDATGKYHW